MAKNKTALELTDQLGYIRLIAAYNDACDRHDWSRCNVLRTLILDAVLREQPADRKGTP